MHISYMEIYNETIYDLLDPEKEIKKMEDLPKVLIFEEENGKLLFKNLRMCKVENEEEALGLVLYSFRQIIHYLN